MGYKYVCEIKLLCCEFILFFLSQALLRLHFDLKQQMSEEIEMPCVHFIETAPSMLQEMPWLLHNDYEVSYPVDIINTGILWTHQDTICVDVGIVTTVSCMRKNFSQ